jgi:DNA-binding CsgD family transcriptional regulator
VLAITAAIAAYGAAAIGNGLGPEQARRAVVDTAAELEAAAASLRRLARLTAADRRALAVELGGDGVSQRQIARTLGVSRRRAWDYLHDRS